MAGVATAVLSALALVAGVLAWVLTPAAADVQTRVRRLAAERGVRVLEPAEVPPLLANALIATEDERFYQNHGVDLIGIGRSALFDVGHLCTCQGASTLTQQLAKEVYLHGSDAGMNKVSEEVLAVKISSLLSKAAILADYLSITRFGRSLYGANEAACAWFKRPLANLDVAQDALLAGMPQAPSFYDPESHPSAAIARRGEVLASMVSEAYITAQTAAAAGHQPLLSGGGAAGSCNT